MSRGPIIAGGLGVLGVAATTFLDRHSAMLAYLSAFVPFVHVALGSLFVLMLGYLVPGRWFMPLRTALSVAALSIPALGLLFVPVLLSLSAIFSWATPAADLTGFKGAYLSPWFFVLRSVIYFGAWTLTAFFCLRAQGNAVAERQVASWGLILYALTASFAGIDWIESLTPHFHSSIFGLLFLGIQAIAGIAFALMAMPLIYRTPPTTQHGQLLLSAILLWGYLHAMQYIVIWAANRPDEVEWYLDRSTGLWAIVTWFVFLGSFALPFIAFLFARVRASSRAIFLLAAFILAMRLIESVWMVLPGHEVNALIFAIALICSYLMIVGLLWTIFALLGGTPHRFRLFASVPTRSDSR